MADPKPSFLRGVVAGATHGSPLFPYPPLDVREPAETAGVAPRQVGRN